MATEEVHRPVDVVLVDLCGLLDAFADAGLGGLMIDDICVRNEVVDEVGVGDRTLDEFVRSFRVDRRVACGVGVLLFDAEVVVGLEVVEDGNVVTVAGEVFCEMAGDEAGAPVMTIFIVLPR
jgi:hypothetical protein